MDEIEVDLELASTRSTNTGFSIATDLEENGRMGFMLVEKEVDGEKVIDFVLPNDKGDKKKRKKARSMAARSSQMEGEFTIDRFAIPHHVQVAVVKVDDSPTSFVSNEGRFNIPLVWHCPIEESSAASNFVNRQAGCFALKNLKPLQRPRPSCGPRVGICICWPGALLNS